MYANIVPYELSHIVFLNMLLISDMLIPGTEFEKTEECFEKLRMYCF